MASSLSPESAAFLVMAEERLQVAQENLAAGHVRDAVGRSYYAMHNAAQALLRARRIIVKTHRGIGLALRNLALEGVLDADDVAAFQRAMRVREEGDYEVSFQIEARDAAIFLDSARRFVSKVGGLLTPK